MMLCVTFKNQRKKTFFKEKGEKTFREMLPTFPS